jgi:hypothetical protein
MFLTKIEGIGQVAWRFYGESIKTNHHNTEKASTTLTAMPDGR